MGMLGRSWNEEESDEQVYNNIMGSSYLGRSKSELLKDIERSIKDSYSSRSERSALRDLMSKMNNDNS